MCIKRLENRKHIDECREQYKIKQGDQISDKFPLQIRGIP